MAMTMHSLRLLLTAMVGLAAVAHASLLRKTTFAKREFRFQLNPHATDPCLEPNCVNHVKEGYVLQDVPMRVAENVDFEFQGIERRPNMAGNIWLTILTQPGCAVSGVSTNMVVFGLIPKVHVEQVNVAPAGPLQPDGNVLIHFGGLFYEHLPTGALAARFETMNYRTQEDSCTFTIVNGTKIWI